MAASEGKKNQNARGAFLPRISYRQKAGYLNALRLNNPGAKKILIYPINEYRVMLFILDDRQIIIKTGQLLVTDGHPIYLSRFELKRKIEEAEKYIWDYLVEKAPFFWIKKTRKNTGRKIKITEFFSKRFPKILPAPEGTALPAGELSANRIEMEKFRIFTRKPRIQRQIFRGMKYFFREDLARWILFPKMLLGEIGIYPYLYWVDRRRQVIRLYYFSPFGRFSMRIDADTLVKKIIQNELEKASQ